jgi:DNA-binding transcriptional LysR family regulator
MEIIKKTTFDRIYAFQLATIVLKEGSFVAAARRLNITPSNITKEIQKLEEYLGAKIFKRTTRSLSLTQEGKIALERARAILNDLHELEDHIHGAVDTFQGSLRITAPNSLGQSVLAKYFAQYQLDHPYMDLDLRYTDRILDPVEQDIDLSIRTAFSLKDSNLYVKNLGQLERVVVASHDYLSHFKEPRNPENLHKHNCLLHMRGDSPFIWSFSKGRKELNIHVQGTFKSNNLMSLVKACEMGVGILNIPRYVVEDKIQDGTLKVLFKSWKLPAHNIFLLSSRKPSESKRLNTMIEFLTESLRPYCKRPKK